ncbi:MAG: glycoside hydrolase family 15 protein [Glaciihabitans sp.]|nr:glycoside hydrolase family 15 protein [Glaciihabitans sp.]
MVVNIEDYALIGDCHTGALVSRTGSIDWLCFPRFDSASLFGAILGSSEHGNWSLAPTDESATSTRAYVDDTFILCTRWSTEGGEVEVIDFMPHGDRRADLVRRVRGISGTVSMRQELRIRFDYAAALPWMRQAPEAGGNALVAIAGPDALVIRGPKLAATDHAHSADFTVSAGETVDITMTWFPSHRPVPEEMDVDQQLESTTRWWREWATISHTPGRYNSIVQRSLLVLRALTHEDTGGIVAAATTSLPEAFGGSRNWDYRYVWLRDASLTLVVLSGHGYAQEGLAWRGWLLRALAGDPADVQIMYGLSGERRLAEWEVDSLPGHNGAAPVRVGNGAYLQYQGDVFGEVMLALQKAREAGEKESPFSWALQRALLQFVEDNWSRPDNGIWEIRGPQRHFTHSRVMLWAALDCGIRGVRDFGLDGPVERWEQLRAEVTQEIEANGFDTALNSYTQFYGSGTVDASLLQLAQVGYLEPTDPRMLGTVAAIESELLHNGLLMRYRTETGVDGLAGTENPFLACSFWLVEQYALSGRTEDATALMDRLVSFANDLGLLSEEYDVENSRQAGNYPQALSHLALVRAADALASASYLSSRKPEPART